MQTTPPFSCQTYVTPLPLSRKVSQKSWRIRPSGKRQCDGARHHLRHKRRWRKRWRHSRFCCLVASVLRHEVPSEYSTDPIWSRRMRNFNRRMRQGCANGYYMVLTWWPATVVLPFMLPLTQTAAPAEPRSPLKRAPNASRATLSDHILLVGCFFYLELLLCLLLSMLCKCQLTNKVENVFLIFYKRKKIAFNGRWSNFLNFW